MGPSLAGSPRVNGNPGSSISTVIYGMEGALDGKTYAAGIMAPMGANDDKWIANVISYVRTSFGNIGRPVTAEMVAAVRKADKRDGHWTQESIEKRYAKPLTDRAAWKITAKHNQGDVGEMVDGDLNTRYDTNTPRKNGMWIAIELPGTHRIDGLNLNTVGSPQDFAEELSIETSTDGATWKKVALNKPGIGAITEIIFPTPVEATHVRIINRSNSGNKYWSVHDLNILATKL